MGHMILRKSVEGAPGDSGAILGKGTLGKWRLSWRYVVAGHAIGSFAPVSEWTLRPYADSTCCGDTYCARMRIWAHGRLHA